MVNNYSNVVLCGNLLSYEIQLRKDIEVKNINNRYSSSKKIIMYTVDALGLCADEGRARLR
jgi:hypothetical protein